MSGRRARPAGRLVRLALAAGIALATLAPAPGAGASSPCYVTSRSGFFDDLGAVNSADLNPATNEIFVGSTGTLSIETLASQPATGTLYAVDYDQLGTIDTSTAAWFPMASVLGSGNGSLGVRAFADAQGLSFHHASSRLYAVVISSEPELLIRLSPGSGAAVTNAFGVGLTYPPSPCLRRSDRPTT